MRRLAKPEIVVRDRFAAQKRRDEPFSGTNRAQGLSEEIYQCPCVL